MNVKLNWIEHCPHNINQWTNNPHDLNKPHKLKKRKFDKWINNPHDLNKTHNLKEEILTNELRIPWIKNSIDETKVRNPINEI